MFYSGRNNLMELGRKAMHTRHDVKTQELQFHEMVKHVLRPESRGKVRSNNAVGNDVFGSQTANG